MNDKGSTPRAASRFATTHWSVVLRAGGSPTDDSQEALSELVESYWYPLYSFARRRGNNHHDAMDLTQGFFTHLLGGNALDSVLPAYGRFRSFLLASFKNFISNDRRARNAKRRGGAVTIGSLTGSEFAVRYDREPVDEETPELLFERRWVETLLNSVRCRLADDYERAGKTELFRLLEPHLTFADDAIPRAEICRQLSLSSAAVAMSIYRMRRRYAELLREEVASTLDDPADIDDEVRTLMAIVGRTG